ncbi:PREDICTED: uncharacterized protein LOC106099971, partial [Papilio polytes]|uniref:uncharacterized protein LOC106099971 n=1 Tax=Papilio polytes TaxID=76194 RepID=UPI000675CEB4
EPNKKVTPVTETDEALVKLTSAEARLEADLDKLTKELNSADSDARAALKLGNRLAAKNHLRRKHKISTRVQRCDAALDNVRQLLQQMREVDSNTAIVDTYRTSSQAMKRTMKEGGLEEDSVFDTMDELKEVSDNLSQRKESERDFVFDGEERMLAELDKLSLEDTTPKKMDRKPVAVTETADN